MGKGRACAQTSHTHGFISHVQVTMLLQLSICCGPFSASMASIALLSAGAAVRVHGQQETSVPASDDHTPCTQAQLLITSYAHPTCTDLHAVHGQSQHKNTGSRKVDTVVALISLSDDCVCACVANAAQ